ncbi:NAD-dependent epimerase/dehydratase family protein [Rhodovulum sp. PH10]|uniref:NAD-dependent epimerase/dehydratase family protein n=1 Tax=Rhodovulum sp. PH10 TaxID=1187851 RepID=UPI000590ACDF|nr:NAD-dependent epimerase/dehydratase family protein [Rhodovulum sp. PH10]
MPTRVLVTGGAGFIGSHVTDLLLERGFAVRVLDNLDPQVHDGNDTPRHLSAEAELIVGDVRDPDAVARALDGAGAVIHLAASVGVGQSMYEIASYTEVNDLGTAVLMEALLRRPVERMVIASSMSVYGEGSARHPDGTIVAPDDRTADQLRKGRWDLETADGTPLAPVPTAETKPPALGSIYALGKFVQERMGLITGRAYGIPTVALRFFNVFGPRQALSNPYTGVLAIFAARLLNGRPPMVFEDGLQRRDFVHVRDVAQACLLALGSERAVGGVYNVGSGASRTILSIADDLAAAMNVSGLAPCVTGKARAGDIRHCFADPTKSRAELGFVPAVDFREGLAELAGWLATEIAVDRVDQATAELERRGLVA